MAVGERMRALFYLGTFITIVVLVLTAGWATLALWYRLPASEIVRYGVCSIFALLGIATIIAQFGGRRYRWLTSFAVAFGAVLVWWNSIDPPADGNWPPDLARHVTGEINGEILTLTNVREFQWRGEQDFTEKWATEVYDLSELQTFDLFLSYWGGPTMAHFVLSFGFADGRYVAWSVEVRREIGSGFSPLADLFKSHSLIIIAAAEEDVLGVRSNIRGEDVQIYRMRATPEQARELLLEYVREANDLVSTPRWYNSLTTNCTTAIFKMLSAAGEGIPIDWRIIVNGNIPSLIYDRGTVNTNVTFSELTSSARIAPRAIAAGLDENYSTAIREGVPKPY